MSITVTCEVCHASIEGPDADTPELERHLAAGTGPYALPCHCKPPEAAASASG